MHSKGSSNNNLVHALEMVQQQQLGSSKQRLKQQQLSLCTAKAPATTTKFMHCKGSSNNN